ncbi:MAG: DUF3426 domain-containing protein [Gammaproteobacteria bacterium]|nr:DUF3426 domain-containing protein [Gammaproteobacteria bacterium]
MYSQCPECHTRFRVTADALRAAHGTVRCGRCGSAFDALARLSDTVPPARETVPGAPLLGVAATAAAAPEVMTAAEYHFTADDLEKVFIDARDWQQQFGTEKPGETANEPIEESTAAPLPEATAVEVAESVPLEDITLEGERISIEVPADWPAEELEAVDLDATDEFEALSEVPESAYPQDDGTDETPGLVMVGTAEPEPLATGITASPPQTLAEQRWHRTSTAESAAEPAEAARHERSGWRTLAWSLGCLVLAVVLLAQVTHYYRQDLVRHPQLGPLLRNVYDRLGLPLSPNWDLAAFELRQWGNGSAADMDGRMSVRASLTNRAAFAQPYPILRLELDDRFGESIAVRDFEPREYLKNPAEASRMLGAGATTEADLEIADPGREAVGYQLDLCLRESATLLRCAQGPG